MKRALFILAFIWPCFAKLLNPSDLLNLEALNEELEYVSDRLNRFMANQEGDEVGLDLPTQDVTWNNLANNIENLINQTVQLHLTKLDSKCSEIDNSCENALKKVKTLEEDLLQMSSTLGNKVRECSEKAVLWKENLIDAEKNVKFASDSVNSLKAMAIEIQNNISKQEENTTNINIELQKLISSLESTSKEQADINSAILKLEEQQDKLMEKMGYEMIKDLKKGNEDLKQENNFMKSFLDQIMGKIVELKDYKENCNGKVEELIHKLDTLKTGDNTAEEEYISTRAAIEQLRNEVTTQTEELNFLKQSSPADDELRQVRVAMDAIRASASSHPDLAAVEAKIAEARKSCVTNDDVRRLLQSSQDSKCSAKVKHTPGRPSRLQIEIVSSGKRKT